MMDAKTTFWLVFFTGVSLNDGTPKWVFYNGKPYFLMVDLGGKPIILGNTHIPDPQPNS